MLLLFSFFFFFFWVMVSYLNQFESDVEVFFELYQEAE